MDRLYKKTHYTSRHLTQKVTLGGGELSQEWLIKGAYLNGPMSSFRAYQLLQWQRNRSGWSGFGWTTFHGEKLKLRLIVNNYPLITVMFVS